MEKVKPTIIKPEGMTFEELIAAYEKKCSMWNELKDFVIEEYRKTSSMQEIYAYYEVIKEIEQLEKENEQ